MNRITTIITGGALALTVTAASAAEVDTDNANYLLRHCKALLDNRKSDDFEQGVCKGTVYGVARALGTARTMIKSAAQLGIRLNPPSRQCARTSQPIKSRTNNCCGSSSPTLNRDLTKCMRTLPLLP